jgi:hypothetical protein
MTKNIELQNNNALFQNSLMVFLADDVLAKAAYHSLLYNPDKCVASGQPTSLPSGSLAVAFFFKKNQPGSGFGCSIA